MISSIFRKLSYFYNKFAIEYKIKTSINIATPHKTIKFHDIKGSTLLKNIALEGMNSFEPELVKFIQDYPFEINTFVDGGSNIGFYSAIAASNLNKKISIYTIEPFPLNVQYIYELKKENNLEFNVIEKVLHDVSDQYITLHYPVHETSSKLSSSASVIDSFKGTDGIYSDLPAEQIKVQSITLEDVLRNTKYPALVKLDLEGHELTVLKQAKNILERNDIDFVIELLITDEDKNEIFDLMKSYGYDAYLLTTAGLFAENRPTTLPAVNNPNRTYMRNHLFTKRAVEELKAFSITAYKNWL